MSSRNLCLTLFQSNRNYFVGKLEFAIDWVGLSQSAKEYFSCNLQ